MSISSLAHRAQDVEGSERYLTGQGRTYRMLALPRSGKTIGEKNMEIIKWVKEAWFG
jgi:hypothetical protein